MFLLSRLQQNYDAKDENYLTLSSIRKEDHIGVYLLLQEILNRLNTADMHFSFTENKTADHIKNISVTNE